MPNITSYFGTGLYGILRFVDWIMFVSISLGLIGILQSVIRNPRTEIRNVWRVVLHYTHLSLFIGIWAVLLYTLFWNNALAWLPPILIFVFAGTIIAQQVYEARAERNDGAMHSDLDSLALSNGSLDTSTTYSDDRIELQQFSESEIRAMQFVAYGTSIILKLHRVLLGRFHPAGTKRMADMFTRKIGMPKEIRAPLYREALLAARQKWGDLHLRTADSMETLAETVSQTKADHEAEDLYRSAIAIRETLQGPEHLATQIVKNKLLLVSERKRRKT
jgi:hypothetical protein